MAYDWEARRIMRIGVLTLHSQTNYGGVLQAFALQETLKGMGHDAVIIDRWMDEHNSTLNGITSSRSIVGWGKFLCRAMLGFGDGADYIRHVRTASRLPSFLNLTPYSFYHWKDAPRELGVDAIIVGSDQVWNPAIQGKELPYLLEGAPNVPAIAYAASFGVRELPDFLKDSYRKGLQRFKAVSVREKEAVGIVESIGGTATQVLDPTLLAKPSVWNRFLDGSSVKKRRKLVCYLIQDPLAFVLSDIRDFAGAFDCEVEIFFGAPCSRLPSGVVDLVRISTAPIRSYLSPRVHTRAMATPDEFVQEVFDADWVLTDSFHALMFSTIFKKNIRVLKPRMGRGAAGFARLSEFCESFVAGHVICDDVPSALHSLSADVPVVYDSTALADAIGSSRRWIEGNLPMVGRRVL